MNRASAVSTKAFYSMPYETRKRMLFQMQRDHTAHRTEWVSRFLASHGRQTSDAQHTELVYYVDWKGTRRLFHERNDLLCYEVPQKQIDKLFFPVKPFPVGGHVMDENTITRWKHKELGSMIAVCIPEADQHPSSGAALHEIRHIENWNLPNARLLRASDSALFSKSASNQTRLLSYMQCLKSHVIDETCSTIYPFVGNAQSSAVTLDAEIKHSVRIPRTDNCGELMRGWIQADKSLTIYAEAAAQLDQRSTDGFRTLVMKTIQNMSTRWQGSDQDKVVFQAVGQALQILTFDEAFNDLESVARSLMEPKQKSWHPVNRRNWF